MQQAFWSDGTLFLLDEPNSDVKPSDNNVRWGQPDGFDTSSRLQLTIRCFGHTNEPVVKLLDHLKAELLKDVKLQVNKVMPGNTMYESREKRQFSFIDLEPNMRNRIQ